MAWNKSNRAMLHIIFDIVKGGTDEWRVLVFGESDINAILRRSPMKILYDLVKGEVGSDVGVEAIMNFCTPKGVLVNLCRSYGLKYSDYYLEVKGV